MAGIEKASTSGAAKADSDDDIKLHKAAKPWKPSFKLKRSSDTCHGLSEKKKLKRNALSILNKITPEKLELLLKQLVKLGISDEQKSNVIISLIYKKAVREPMYITTYVKMCKFLAPIKISSTSFQSADFHFMFLIKCRIEFQNALVEQSEFQDKLDKIARSRDRKKLERAMWEKQYIVKQKLLGNVKLLGELFNQDMAPKSDVHNSLDVLSLDESEVIIEAKCLLLKTAGKKLCEGETARNLREIDKIFQEMQSIAEKRKMSTRIRFMILDVIDLKKNNWVSRRKEIVPKTMEEIHREAMLEASIRSNIDRAHQNSEDQFVAKSKDVLEVYLEDNEMEPVFQYVSSLLPERTIIFMISTFLLHVLEKSPQNRESVGELMYQLVRKKVITLDQYRDGLCCAVDKCKELEADAPLIWNNIGEVLYPLMKIHLNGFQYLNILLEPHATSNVAEKIVSAVFRCIALKEGNDKAKTMLEAFKADMNELFFIQCNIDDIISAGDSSKK